MNTAITVFVSLCLMLVVGKLLRVNLPFLQRLYLPSSIVGGLVGLAAMCTAGDAVPAEFRAAMQKTPGFLINVIFATIFLGAAVPKVKDVVRFALPQLCLGQVIAWGQYVLGLGFAGFVFTRLFGVPAAFGNLLEIGFEGGHGTVAGMSEAFAQYHWEEGAALGFTIATVGMILGITLGMVLVNWAYSRGIVKTVRPFDSRTPEERRGIHARNQRPSAGAQTVYSDSIDSLAWHFAIVGLAMLIGLGILYCLKFAEIALLPGAETRLFAGFPLFPLCMLGGAILQFGAKRLKKKLLVDRTQMERISGAALDFLVASAVATIQPKVVAANWQPLVILVAAGAVWSVLCVLFLAPRLFRYAWFERAIAEFGQATGVTATGLMLLRTVDPENKTPAAMSFGYKQLLHEPFMGGGLWTALALTLVFQVGWLKVFWISLAMLSVWIAIAVVIVRRTDVKRERNGQKG